MKVFDENITRRRFVKGASALGLILPGMSALVSPALSAPKRGGHVRAAFNSSHPNETLDPLRPTTSLDYARLVQLYDGLTVIAPDLTTQPRLAESWEPVGGAMTWRFNIRKGVQFHDGKALTSKDVVYSLRRHMGGSASGSVISAYFDEVSSIEAEGDHTVVVSLKRPSVDFPTYLADQRAIITRDGISDYSQGIGTGPFMLKEFVPGTSSLFVRNPNYWQEGKPYIDSIEEFGIGDTIARTNALLSGEVHFAQYMDPSSFDLINNSGRARVERAPSARHFYFAAMCDRDPTANPDLRLALKYLLDRERMLRVVRKGLGQIGNDHPVPPNNPWYNADIPVRPYDPERAAFHLKKGGISDLTLQLHTSQAGSPVADDASLLYQNMVEAAGTGLKIEVVRQPVDGYWTNIWQNRPFVASGWTPRPTVDLMFTHWYSSGSSWNDTAWKNERFDQILQESRGTLDEQKRREMYNELQLLIHETGGVLIPAFEDLLDGVSTDLDGFVPHQNAPLSDFKFAEMIWFK